MFHRFTSSLGDSVFLDINEIAAIKAGVGNFGYPFGPNAISNTVVWLRSGTVIELQDEYTDLHDLLINKGDNNNGKE